MDVLFLYMIMDSGMDGIETYKRIIEMHPYQKAFIINEYAETDLVRETRKLDAGAYIKKHFERIGIDVRNELDRWHIEQC